MTKVGIVILNYNDLDTTKNMLNQIKDYDSLDHIVVVDNKSPDGSYDALQAYASPKIDIIQAPENRGYSAGNNVGIKHLINKYYVDYIIISNPDITVDNNTIHLLKNELDTNEKAKLIAPTIHELNDIKRGWKLPTYYGEMITILNTKQRFHKDYGLYGKFHYTDKLSRVEVVSGCFFMIRSSVLQEINYFDEGTFLYYEENILGHILKEKDYASYILNEASITHNLSVSVDKSINKLNKYKILVQSLLYYEQKYNDISGIGLWFLKVLYNIALLIIKIKNIFKR